jgi:preprotein translocase subunit SecD
MRGGDVTEASVRQTGRMRFHRTARAGALVTTMLVLVPVLGGCSSGSDTASDTGSSSAASAASPSPHGTAAHSAPTTAPAGRTTVTYTASRPGSGAPTDEDMRNTADRLRKRATALGLTGADVTVRGTTVTVAAAGDNAEALRQLAATAELEFRPVLDPATAGQLGLQQAYGELTCTRAGTEPPLSRPDQPTVACDRKDPAADAPAPPQKYLLAPSALTGTDVQSAVAHQDAADGGAWVVDLECNRAGRDKFATVTAHLSQESPPANQFAIVVDGEVLAAPAVASTLTGGDARIAGSFTQDSARNLAAEITSGALPVKLTVGDVTQQS